MKIISKIILMLILSFSFSSLDVNAWFFDDLFQQSQPKVHIECWEWKCDLKTGTDLVKDTVGGIENDRTFSEYIQSVVIYLLSFISFIAVVYIIYAWFRILVWAWEEEVLKKQKSTILYVIIWMAVIWLAYPIVIFIINALNWNPTL